MPVDRHSNLARRPRAESEAIARSLRAEGLTGREIAARMGVARSTVDSWLNDPGGARLRSRKDTYRGVCEDCGAPTDGSNGRGAAPKRCSACIAWTREMVVDAFQRWAESSGGIPPRIADTRGVSALPCPATVEKYFGTWNAGLLAAGFELHRDTRPETWDEMRSALERGETVSEIADRFGVNREAIYQRLRVRGLSMAEVRGRTAA